MLKENIVFRKANIDDIESIVFLCNECFMENTSVDKAKEIFKKYENDDKQIYLVGVINNEIVSHVKVTIIPTIYEEMGTYAILNHVCVKKNLRRNNIASKMLDEVSKICTYYGCKSMKLWSLNFRVDAHAFYKSYGFYAEDAKFFVKEIR